MKFIELINQSKFLKKRLEHINDIFKNSLVEGVTNNSKKVKKNYIFFANIGDKTNGNKFRIVARKSEFASAWHKISTKGWEGRLQMRAAVGCTRTAWAPGPKCRVRKPQLCPSARSPPCAPLHTGTERAQRAGGMVKCARRSTSGWHCRSRSEQQGDIQGEILRPTLTRLGGSSSASTAP